MAYQVGINPKHFIHLHTVTMSITNNSLPRRAVPTDETHLVAAPGRMTFKKQSFCFAYAGN